jgi:hypothetical protein
MGISKGPSQNLESSDTFILLVGPFAIISHKGRSHNNTVTVEQSKRIIPPWPKHRNKQQQQQQHKRRIHTCTKKNTDPGLYGRSSWLPVSCPQFGTYRVEMCLNDYNPQLYCSYLRFVEINILSSNFLSFTTMTQEISCTCHRRNAKLWVFCKLC